MNNVTHEQSIHTVSLTHRDAGDEEPTAPLNELSRKDRINASEVLSGLDEIRYRPRAATIRAIMHYAHKKDAALH